MKKKYSIPKPEKFTDKQIKAAIEYHLAGGVEVGLTALVIFTVNKLNVKTWDYESLFQRVRDYIIKLDRFDINREPRVSLW